MRLDLTSILFVLIIFQLLFLSTFLFTQQKGKRISHWLLGSFFLSIALNLLDVFLLMNRAYSSCPALAGWGSCIPLVFGPLLYLYTRSVLQKRSGFSWVHFLPFAVFFLGTEIFYVSEPRATQELLLQNALAHRFHWSVSLASSIIFLQFSLYIAFSLDLIARHKKAATQHFSNPGQTSLSWLYTMLVFFMFLMIGTTLNGLLAGTPLANHYLLTFSVIILAMLIFINRVLLKALHTPYFFAFEEGEAGDRLAAAGSAGAGVTGAGSAAAGSAAAFSTTTLGNMEAAGGAPAGEGAPVGEAPLLPENKENLALAQRLRLFMQTEKPWLNPDLSLEELAVAVGQKPKMLSIVINETLGQNFFDFINHYRVDEAKRLLTNPVDEKITVLEVLYAVGFNSKSSFNTLFKKYTGLTPTEFRRRQEVG
jgi:AraC-like DNA-binding protein